MYIFLYSAYFFTFVLPISFPTSSFTVQKPPHLNARSKSVPLPTVPSALFECQYWKHASMTLASVLDQSGLLRLVWSRCVSILGLAREGLQMALSLQYRSSKMFYYILRYIGIYLPIYWIESIFRYWCKIFYINIFQCAYLYSKARRRSHFTFMFASAPSSD